MPGSIAQELTRILNQMRSKGVENVYLSAPNLAALQGKLTQAVNLSPALPRSPASFPQIQRPQMQAPAQQPVSRPPMPAQVSVQQAVAHPQIQQNPVSEQPSAEPARSPMVPATWEADCRNASLEQLGEICRNCHSCNLSVPCNKRMFLAGQPRARVVFVGDFPTVEEDMLGRPFAGPAGTMLYKMGTAMGLAWENSSAALATAYITILKCRPSAPPTTQQLNACRPVLIRQLELLQPDAIVCLGNLATKCLTGKTVGFSQLKGQWQTYLGIPCMPIQHPAQIMLQANMPAMFASERRAAWTSLQEVMSFLGLKH